MRHECLSIEIKMEYGTEQNQQGQDRSQQQDVQEVSVETEADLWICSVKLAIEDFCSPAKNSYTSAINFLFIDDRNRVGSFRWICDTIGVDIDAARMAILRRKYDLQIAKAMMGVYKQETKRKKMELGQNLGTDSNNR